ncbi:MAG: hypothetical protein JXA54_05515 [Candidatus Heimdallarchaeota archaeon]|nr:hypothetical protein [Candidatus Heimdallarchaeota archaeon]
MSEIDVLRVEDTKVRRMRNLLNINRVFAILVFISGFALVISSIDPVVWNFQSFWFGLKFIVFIFELLFLLIGYGIALLLGYDDAGAVALMSAIHSAIFGGSDTVLGIPIQEWILNPLQIPTDQSIVDAFYSFFIIITIIIALIAGLGFVRECNPALSATSFFAMNIVIGLASLNGKLLIDLNFSSGNIIDMIFSKLVITAFLIYFFLELSFQASYIYNVIGPNIQRHRRISSNIKRLKNFNMPIVQETKIALDEEEENGQIKVKGKATSVAMLKVTTAFSRVKGMVGKRLFKISIDEDWDKMNNRLKNFYLNLEEDDPFLSISLSASANTPSISRLIFIISIGTIFRMGMLFILSWLALNPQPILQFLHMPESIINSVEAGQPEMIMLVLAPLAVTFLLIGLIVQFIQKRVAQRMQKGDNGLAIHSVSEIKEMEKKRIRRRRKPAPLPE